MFRSCSRRKVAKVWPSIVRMNERTEERSRRDVGIRAEERGGSPSYLRLLLYYISLYRITKYRYRGVKKDQYIASVGQRKNMQTYPDGLRVKCVSSAERLILSCNRNIVSHCHLRARACATSKVFDDGYIGVTTKRLQ